MSANPPWILLRGLMRDGRHWGAFIAEFQRHVPGAVVIALDLPGNGLRYRETSGSRVPDMADWVRAELIRQGHAPPYRVLAMSLGAMVAAAWADRHAHEVAACVLINTSLKPFSPFYRRLQPAAWPLLLRMALSAPTPRAAEQAILELTSRHQPATSSVLDDWTAWRQSHPVSRANALRQLLAALRYQAPRQAPATDFLVLTGARDALVDHRCSLTLAKAWGTALAVHATAGHDLPLDDGPWVARQVAEWCAATARGRTTAQTP